MVSEQVLQEVTRRLVEGFHPEAIILFGSQARGTADERSDIDVLVLFGGEHFQDETPDRGMIARMYAALRGVPCGVDLVPMSVPLFDLHREIAGTVAYPASREGRVLYKRAA